jgi:alcohol dehydrogenase, propanol-preferring
VIVYATHISAYPLSLQCVRKKGTIVCVSLPKGEPVMNINNMVLRRITLRGSIIGTREDMREALDFAARGLVHCDVHIRRWEEINTVIDEMKARKINGRVVLKMEGNSTGSIEE